MTKSNITQYSATAGSNTDIDGIDISEGMSPSNVNNSIRALMSHLKDMDAGTTTLTAPKGTNITASTALKTPAIQYTDGDAAITIADGGGVTANNFSSTSVNIDGGAIDGITLGTNSAVTQAVIDNININGTTIGHTSDTDLMTITSGLLTVAGEVSMTTLDIGGDNVTATATELNITDGDTSVGTTAVAGGDGIVTNDNGTMRQTSVDTFDTYLAATTKTLTNKTLTTPTLTSPVLNTGVSGSAVLDEDNFASNSATQLATQQSIKAYVDTSANASSTSATASANSATASATSATLSQTWATKTDGEAENGEGYASKAWAIGGTGVTDASGGGSAKQWSTDTDSTVDGTEYSAKEYAVGAQRRGAANGGSAKDWATYTGGTVDNSGYSAKYWAEQAAASHDSFDDKYLGSKSSAPSVDNDGASLTDGALYKNSSDGKLYFYNLSNTTWTAIETGATEGFAVSMAIAL
jgi:hypothetical protein